MPHRKLATDANMSADAAQKWMDSVESRLGEMGSHLADMGEQVGALKVQNDVQDQRLQESTALMMTLNKTLNEVRADTKPLVEMLRDAHGGLRTLGRLDKLGSGVLRIALWGSALGLVVKALFSGHSFADAWDAAAKLLK